MMMKSGFWWREPEYPEETTDPRQNTELRSQTNYINNNNIKILKYEALLCPLYFPQSILPYLLQPGNFALGSQMGPPTAGRWQ